ARHLDAAGRAGGAPRLLLGLLPGHRATRAGAESLAEAQKGLALAAFLKLLIPLIVVVPGIAALILAQDGALAADPLNERPDRTYGTLMTLAPEGLRGLVFAALIAAIVSSLASMMNSISTIFTMDIYRDYIAKDKGERHYVLVGRLTALAAMIAALFLARPFLGGLESAFQTIQEYSGFIAPGVVAIFLLGFFFKRANAAGAFAVLIGSVAISLAMKFGLPDMPFVLRIWIVFLAIMVLGVLVSLVTQAPREDQPVALGDIEFHTRPVFNVAAITVAATLIAIYVVYW
ncbi:MAG: hypothetical protein AAFR33_12115, partial [Pseudomonadota bacterium]